ncbi:MAG: hypothetical protein AAGK04_13525, partial [Planctomycetota bacterium]
MRRLAAAIGVCAMGMLASAQPGESNQDTEPAAPASRPEMQAATQAELDSIAARQITRLALMDLRLRRAPTEADYELVAALRAVAQSFAPK